MATETTNKSTLMVGILLSLTWFIAPVSSNALPIPQYDEMSEADQARYASELFSNSADMLLNQGRHQELRKLLNLFEKKPGAQVSEGTREFKSALAGLRNLPNDKPYHVEHAYAHILREHGVPLSADELKQLARAGKSFKTSNK